MPRRLSLTPQRIVTVLCHLRWLAAAIAAGAIIAAQRWLDASLPLLPMAVTVAALLAWNVATLWRLRRYRAATHLEVVVHLGVDTAAITTLLAYTGGATSPFVSAFLLPIALAAASTPARYAWSVTVLCAMAYTGLLWQTSLPAAGQGLFFQLHVLGMWVNFLFSALLLTASLTLLSGILRERDRALAQAREQALRDERLIATGTLAAGTAHELNTPLSTMAVLLGDLRSRHDLPEDARDDLGVLQEQIEVCRRRIHTTLSTADPARHGPRNPQPLRDYLANTFATWRLLRPEARLQTHYVKRFANPLVAPEVTLDHALGNLLDNAADASATNGSAHVGVCCRADEDTVLIAIEDDGPGLAADQVERAGKGLFSTKAHGHGLGLVLSNANIARLDGEVRLLPREAGGTRTEVQIPIAALRGRAAA